MVQLYCKGVTSKCFFFFFLPFLTACHVEMRTCTELMEIRSHCCLTEATFAVIASVINLWDERRQASASLWWLRVALKNCCYEWHSGLMNMNTFIKIGTGSPLSADWEWQSHRLGHGWWEKEPPPLEIEDVAVIRGRTRTNTPHAINRRQMPQHAFKAPAFKKEGHCLITDHKWANQVFNWSKKQFQVSIIVNFSICWGCQRKMII